LEHRRSRAFKSEILEREKCIVLLAAKEAQLTAECEVAVPVGGEKTYSPDIVIAQPLMGVTTRKSALDLTVTNGFAPYQLKAAAKSPLAPANYGQNHKRHEIPVEALERLGFDFIPLSFEVSGGCTVETEKLIHAVLAEKARIVNIPFSEVVTEFWQLLSITMQRANAEMIRRRLAYVDSTANAASM
jgi:hypothetical protein